MKKFKENFLITIKRLIFLNHFFYIVLICFPLLIYFGEKSFIAFDEGYYALQGKWVLDYNNWITPQWFEHVQFDRTPLLPVLIAISYKLFGISYFSAHLPVFISTLVVLYFTYKIHEFLIGYKLRWLSPLILITTSLWINYTHLATQDILLVAIEIFGIYFLIESSEDASSFKVILSSIWIGLSFFLKTYMVVIPFIAICPYILIHKRNLLTKNYFYLGLILGFIPVIVWSILSFKIYGLDFFYGINNKVLSLSKNNTFSQPFYYYLWNLPVSFLPWTPFCFNGLRLIMKNYSSKKFYFLFIYPLLLVFLLSLFSTKIPYYSLQAFPFLAISTSYGLLEFSSNLNLKKKRILNKILFTILFIIIGGFIYFLIKKNNFEEETNFYIFISLLSIIFLISPPLLINIFSSRKLSLFSFLIGPYLTTLLVVQTGLLSNRSPAIKLAINNLYDAELISDNEIYVITPKDISGKELSEIIKINLYSKSKIKRGNNPSKIKSNQLIWITNNDVKKFKNLTTKFKSKKLSEWVLTEKF